MLLSVDRDMIAYDTLKSLIATDRLSCIQNDTFLSEMRRLELKQGKKVDHPPNGSKDCADAVAGICRTLMEQFDVQVEEEETFVDESVQVKITEEI